MDWRFPTAAERHRPPHAPGDGQPLFLTASTYRRAPHLAGGRRKEGFHSLLRQHCASFEVELLAWVLLDDHYHLVLNLWHPAVFSGWIGGLHRESARAWNEEDQTPGRQVWYEYWDTSLWTDGDVWSRVNYVHANPVKHGYVSDPGAWEWSSYREFAALPSEVAANLDRFPAPRQLPHDHF